MAVTYVVADEASATYARNECIKENNVASKAHSSLDGSLKTNNARWADDDLWWSNVGPLPEPDHTAVFNGMAAARDYLDGATTLKTAGWQYYLEGWSYQGSGQDAYDQMNWDLAESYFYSGGLEFLSADDLFFAGIDKCNDAIWEMQMVEAILAMY
jgi:hypothetical protein